MVDIHQLLSKINNRNNSALTIGQDSLRLVCVRVIPVPAPIRYMRQWREITGTIQSALANGENLSVVLTGRAASGKSTVIRKVIDELRKICELEGCRFYALHLNGLLHTNSRIAARSIRRQLTRKQQREAACTEDEPIDNVTVSGADDSVEGILQHLMNMTNSSKSASTMGSGLIVCVLDHFDRFASGGGTMRTLIGKSSVLLSTTGGSGAGATAAISRQVRAQSTLYQLFDCLQQQIGRQTTTMRLCLIGVTSRLDVMQLLEKRVRSRLCQQRTFNLDRHLYANRFGQPCVRTRPTAGSNLLESSAPASSQQHNPQEEDYIRSALSLLLLPPGEKESASWNSQIRRLLLSSTIANQKNKPRSDEDHVHVHQQDQQLPVGAQILSRQMCVDGSFGSLRRLLAFALVEMAYRQYQVSRNESRVGVDSETISGNHGGHEHILSADHLMTASARLLEIDPRTSVLLGLSTVELWLLLAIHLWIDKGGGSSGGADCQAQRDSGSSTVTGSFNFEIAYQEFRRLKQSSSDHSFSHLQHQQPGQRLAVRKAFEHLIDLELVVPLQQHGSSTAASAFTHYRLLTDRRHLEQTLHRRGSGQGQQQGTGPGNTSTTAGLRLPTDLTEGLQLLSAGTSSSYGFSN